MTLVNFEVEGINNFKYSKFISIEKDDYQHLIKNKLMELFIENQNSLKIFYSSTLGLSKNHTKVISEYKVNVKMSKNPSFDMSYDILTSFMQYSSAFYNLASSTATITQNHTDLSNFIYNCLNGYIKAFNLLIDIYGEELDKYFKILNLISIVGCILVLCFLILYIYLIIKSFFKAIKLRGNYMEVFFGINETVLRNLICNCENLMNRLKSSEELRYHEEETLNGSEEGEINLAENKKNKKSSMSKNTNLNYGIENKSKNKASLTGIIFIIVFGIFNLITYLYIIYNGILILNTSRKSITINSVRTKMQKNHIAMIYYFNVYREFLFDSENQSNNINILRCLDYLQKEIIVSVLEDISSISTSFIELYSDVSKLEKSLCTFYINDYFDSSYDCEEKIGLISKYHFSVFTIYFFEEIRIDKNYAKIKIKEKTIVGNLTNYNFDEYSQLASKIEANSNGNSSEGFEYLDDENNSGNNTIFRLDLFNSETLHNKLNVLFFNIIMPYVEVNSKLIFEGLNIDGSEKKVKILNISFYIVVILAFCIYFIPVVSFINTNIYKTKNMLSIIPLDILASQSGVSELLNISKEK